MLRLYMHMQCDCDATCMRLTCDSCDQFWNWDTIVDQSATSRRLIKQNVGDWSAIHRRQVGDRSTTDRRSVVDTNICIEIIQNLVQFLIMAAQLLQPVNRQGWKPMLLPSPLWHTDGSDDGGGECWVRPWLIRRL